MNSPSRSRSRLMTWLVAGLLLALIVASLIVQWWPDDRLRADPASAAQVAAGKQVYEQYCTGCHGGQLQGQPGWRNRKPDGRLPAPPHNGSGHTWHHPDRMLVGVIRDGLVPPWAPDGYRSEMPAFGDRLSDAQIWATLAYIKSRWPQRIRDAQASRNTR